MDHIDNVIVGAGPAGLQMAYFFERAGRDYIVLDGAAEAGDFFSKNPRHRTLLSFNKINNYYPEPEFNLRHDWNSLLSDDPEMLFRHFSQDLYPHADDLARYLRAFAERMKLRIGFENRVTRVSSDPKGFRLTTEGGRSYTCRRLFMASGAALPFIPDDIDGIDLAEGYEDHDLDQSSYTNQKVAIIGSGNSAFEVANHLAGHAAIIHIMNGHPVRHAWNTHFPGDLRSMNNTILDMYQLKSLHATVGFRPRTIKPKAGGGLTVVTDEDYPHWTTPGTGRVTMHYDRVIRCTGWRYIDPSLFDTDCRPEVDQRGKFAVLGANWETSVPGLFYIGTAMQARDRKAASSFIHGFRYNIRTLFNLVEEREHDVPLPGQEFGLRNESDLEGLANHLIRRVSTSSALYQQHGQLCDALVFDEGKVRVSEELPVALVLNREDFTERENLVLLTLEYGFHNYDTRLDTLNFIHPADPSRPECSAFLHPVLRWYRGGVLQNKVDLTESLVVRYDIYDYEENFNEAHVNRVKNLLNTVQPTTSTTYPERPYLPEQESAVFRAWTPEETRQKAAASELERAQGSIFCHYAN